MTERTRRSESRSRLATKRLLDWLDSSSYSAVVLTTPASVAWVTGGISQVVDRSAALSDVWVVVSREGSTLITSEVEVDRIRDEYDPESHGFDGVVAVPWYGMEPKLAAVTEIAGVGAPKIASDGYPGLGEDIRDDLVELRLVLSDPEQEELRSLGVDTAVAIEDGLRSWRPGESDFKVQARVVWALEALGVWTPVVIVGGDERVGRYRHPVANGTAVSSLVMVVVVAERFGVHVATTRFASAGAVSGELERSFATVRRIESAVLASSKPGNTYGDVLHDLDLAYEREGFPRAWKGHYQGGPIGFAQREFEIAPTDRDSRWFRQRVDTGSAVAWNPSLSGGAKVEDTYLVTELGAELVTKSPTWPHRQDCGAESPTANVLEI
ncbi:MAG: M24 family metallopeptidase [Ferrimicrobium sp.]